MSDVTETTRKLIGQLSDPSDKLSGFKQYPTEGTVVAYAASIHWLLDKVERALPYLRLVASQDRLSGREDAVLLALIADLERK